MKRITWIEPDYESEDWQAYCQSDPDIVKANGYQTVFQADGGGKGDDVVIMVEDDYEVRELLQRWVNGEGYSGEIVQSWRVFNDADNAVAYRGGMGYHYVITVFDGQ